MMAITTNSSISVKPLTRFDVVWPKDTHINDTLSDPSRVRFEPIHFPKPVMSIAIHPHSAKDEEKMSTAIHRLIEEDRTIASHRNPNTKELVISGMGDIHLTVAIDNMKRRLGVQVDQSTPKVDYKETITGRGDGHYKHKKQSGGHGQYGEAYVKIEPQERGKGFEFASEVVGGAIPRNFIPAVEKGCVEALQGGVVAGYPVVDVHAIVYDGSYHDVDSNEISFKIAGLHAFKEAMQKARPVLLEPVMNVSVFVPDQFMGDITGDLNHRRGRIMGVEPMDGMPSIKSAGAAGGNFQVRQRTTLDDRRSRQFRNGILPLRTGPQQRRPKSSRRGPSREEGTGVGFISAPSPAPFAGENPPRRGVRANQTHESKSLTARNDHGRPRSTW